MNKRSFLKATTALTMGSLTPAIGYNAISETNSITSLRNMTQKAKPITGAERKARILKAQSLMI